MRIAIFTDTFLPQINGIVTSTITLAKGLANKGHKIFIIAPKFKTKKEFVSKNVKVLRVSSVPAAFYDGFRFANFSPLILRYIKKHKINIIHFQTPLSLGMQAIFISRFLKIPLVGMFHTFISDPGYLKHMKMNNKFFEKVVWTYAKMYYNRCDLVVCPTNSSKKELEQNKFKKPLKVISNGIDLNLFKKNDEKKYKKEESILFVGRIAHEKNIEYLIDCFKLVVDKKPCVKLRLVGGGPQLKEIKQKIKKLGLEKNVVLKGEIPHEKLLKSDIFSKSKIFVTASTTETQGLTLLEAQANGLVSVCVFAKGAKDLITNGINGFLVKKNNKESFANKVVKLLENKKVYNYMRTNTLVEIKKHDLEKTLDEWEKTYKDLMR